MTALVRASALQGYAPLAAALGLDPDAALRRFGLGASDAPTALLPYASVVALFEHTARETGCPDFGLRLASQQGLGILGPVLTVIRHAATIGEALGLASHYLFVHSPAARLSVVPVEEQPELVDLCFDIAIPGRPSCAQACELSLALLHDGLKVYGLGQVRPLLARLPHEQIGPRAAYARAFGCPSRFLEPMAALRIRAAELQRPLSEHNPLMRKLAQDYLDAHFDSSRSVLTDQVRALLRQVLGSGHSARPQVARALGMHPRTLQRRLEAEGASFADILEATRQDLLLQMLTRHKALPLSQIAMMLGYSEQSALSRSCRRWYGCSPRELAQRRHGQQPHTGNGV